MYSRGESVAQDKETLEQECLHLGIPTDGLTEQPEHTHIKLLQEKIAFYWFQKAAAQGDFLG